MGAKHLDDEPSCWGTGLVLKDKTYQSTFEYQIERSVVPWIRPRKDLINSSKLLMRALPLRTMMTSLVYGGLVAMVSFFVWQGLFESLSVSWNSLIQDGQWWRVFSAQFQHADSKHLLNNLMPFVGLGWILWGYFGFLAFPVVPVIAGAVANFVAVWTYPPDVHVVGLSGTVFAMAGLWAALYIKNDFRYTVGKRILRAAGFLLILFFPLSWEQNVSDRVHVLGGLAGLIAGFAGWGRLRSHEVNAPSSSEEKARVRQI
jgi:membrane associated rhomboid family serine protease